MARLIASAEARPWLLPVAAAILVHPPGLFGAFVYDDVPLIPEHPELANTSFVVETWSRDYGLDFSRQPEGYYRPLFMTIVWTIRAIFGPGPLVFHLVSLLCFLAATVLLTRLLFAMTIAPWQAMFAGMLYAVHPARVEVVSLVMSLPDLFVELAALATVGVLVRMQKQTGRAAFPWRMGLLCLAVALAAALSKESALFCLAPLGITAGVFARVQRRPQLLAASGGTLLGLAGGFVARHLAGIQAPAAVSGLVATLVGEKSGAALHAFGASVSDIVVPGPVTYWRLFPATVSGPAGAAGMVSLLVLVGLLWALLVRSRHLAVASLLSWAAGSCFSVMLLAAGQCPFSQRYVPVAPLVALLSLCAGWVYRRVARRAKRPPVLACWTGLLAAVYLAGHGRYALQGVLQCATPVEFFRVMQAANPNDVVPLGALAQELNRSGAPAPQVEALVRQATALDHEHPQVPLLHNMVIKRFLGDGAFHQALRFADESLDVFPDDPDKMALRAVALASLEQFDDALEAVARALEARPANAEYLDLQEQILANSRRGN